MGIYLFIIGIQDATFRNIYNQEAHRWISSWTCTITGMVAMVSSEVSVLLLVFMSVDRWVYSKVLLKNRRIFSESGLKSLV